MMRKPTLNFVWIGPPRLSNGGHDVVGVESLDQNFKHFAAESKEEPNPMVFWCLVAHQKEYQDYFANKGMRITVKAIEPYLEEHKAEDETATKIWEIFTELTHPDRSKIIDYVYFKDLFFNVLLAWEGNYVLDTGMQTNLSKPVTFPHYPKFMFPWLTKKNMPETWMQYSPPDNRQRAQAVLQHYLAHYPLAADIFKQTQYSQKFHDQEGILVTNALRLDKAMSKSEYLTDDCGLWECSGVAGTEIVVPGFNLHKEYYNTHKTNRENAYEAPQIHVLFGNLAKLTFDLDHNVDANAEKSLRKAIVKVLDYDTNHETLLHIAMRYSRLPEQRACAKLLLEKNADPNKTYEFIRGINKKIKTPLIDAIENRSKEAVEILFKYARQPIRLDQILNDETILMTSIRCGGDDLLLLLQHGADANQICETAAERTTALALAVTRRDTAMIELLLTIGKADPNITVKTQHYLSLPLLHIALKYADEDVVRLLLKHGASPTAVAEYRVGNQQHSQTPQQITTSDHCKALLDAALQQQKSMRQSNE